MMSYKNFLILFITIIFLLLIAIPSSFAFNNITNDSLSASDYYFDNNNSDVGNGTLENPFKEINSSNLKDNSIIHLANGEYNLNFSKSFNDISFYGENSHNTFLNCNGFTLTNNGILNFKNITLINVSISNYGNLNASNSVFINSQSDYGGVINSYSNKNVYLDNCEFYNNSANYGGVLYILSGNLECSNTVFENNTASVFGGVITSVLSNLRLKNIRAKNNHAIHEGGVIYSIYGSFSIENSSFLNNYAKNGGALFIDNNTNAIFENNTFKENHANVTAGAIYSLANLNTDFKNNTYINNTALTFTDLLNTSQPTLFIGDGNSLMFMYNSSFTGVLPSYYNLADHGYVTSVKNQGSGGNCWAFASAAALESCILKASGLNLDLSEENIKNIMAKYSDYGWSVETNRGGYEDMAVGYFISWLGAVNESDDEYDPYYILSPILNSFIHVQNVIFLTRNNYTDNDAIKKAILDYGGVATSIKWNGASIKGNARYYSGNDVADHAVVIVGWDDNYSKDNFANKPAGDGAWIIKNSHGTSSGKNGYWYVSYYDTKCAQVGRSDITYTFIFNDTLKYDKNYQYDIPGRTDFFINSSSTVWYKNIFKASDNEYLTAVATHFQKNTNYTVYIIVNDEMKINQSGFSQAGYYTINLKESIPLFTNDTFEVIFKITVDGDAGFPISEYVSLNKLLYTENISFMSYDGELWLDIFNLTCNYTTHVYTSQVACIKAFTVLNLINSSIQLTLDDIKKYTVQAEVLNQYGYHVTGGNVTFNVGNQNYTVDVVNGIATLILSLNLGIYNVSAVYNANGYSSSRNDLLVNVSEEINTTVSLNISNDNNPVTISAQVTDQFGNLVSFGNVTFNLEGVNYTVGVVNGSACLNHYFVNLGLNNVSAIYEGSYYYKYSFIEQSVFIKTKTNISLDWSFDGFCVSFNVTVVDQFGDLVNLGNVTFDFDGNAYNINISNGSACLNCTIDDFDLHNISAKFSGLNYYSSLINESFKVSLIKTFIYLEFSSEFNPVNIIAYVVDQYGNLIRYGNITFNLDGINYTFDVKNGIAGINRTFSDSGLHNVSVWYNGFYYFNQSFVKESFNVRLKETLMTLEFNNNINPVNIIVHVVDQFGDSVNLGNITFNLDGVNYTFGVVNGSVNLSHVFKNIGLNNIYVTYQDSYFYNTSKTTYDLNVESSIISKDSTNVLNSIYSVKLLNSSGDPLINQQISLVIGSTTYNVKTNGEGIASLNIKLNVGTYLIKITNPSNNEIKTQTIKVIPTIIDNKQVSMYYGANSLYKVRVRDINGNYAGNLKVTFNINGKNYFAYTDKNGYASFKINLNPGAYVIVAQYNGFKVSNKVIVKSTIITKDINVKKSKTIKFTAKLVDSKGKILKNKKITFKFKGKTYKIKTNSKGVAVLKITKKYKVGKYTITSSFAKLTIKNKIKITK